MAPFAPAPPRPSNPKCSLCSTPTLALYPKLKDYYPKSNCTATPKTAIQDVLLVAGLAKSPVAPDLSKCLENGDFCTACIKSIIYFHTSMCQIRAHQKIVLKYAKVINDGIFGTLNSWIDSGMPRGEDAGGIGQFLLLENDCRTEEDVELAALEHEGATSVFVGNGRAQNQIENVDIAAKRLEALKLIGGNAGKQGIKTTTVSGTRTEVRAPAPVPAPKKATKRALSLPARLHPAASAPVLIKKPKLSATQFQFQSQTGHQNEVDTSSSALKGNKYKPKILKGIPLPTKLHPAASASTSASSAIKTPKSSKATSKNLKAVEDGHINAEQIIGKEKNISSSSEVGLAPKIAKKATKNTPKSTFSLPEKSHPAQKLNSASTSVSVTIDAPVVAPEITRNPSPLRFLLPPQSSISASTSVFPTVTIEIPVPVAPKVTKRTTKRTPSLAQSLPAKFHPACSSGAKPTLDIARGFIPPKQFHCYPCNLSFQNAYELNVHTAEFHGAGTFSRGVKSKVESQRRIRMKEQSYTNEEDMDAWIDETE